MIVLALDNIGNAKMFKKALMLGYLLVTAILLMVVSCSQEYTSVSGEVFRLDNGQPIAGAVVRVSGPHGSTEPIYATTSDDGNYTVTGLNAGESWVAVWAEGYVIKYYDGINGTYRQEESVQITTEDGKDTPDIDFALEWGGTITGRLYKPDGNAITGEGAILFKQITGEDTPIVGGCEPSMEYRYIQTDGNGNFNIGGLMTGDIGGLRTGDYDLLTKFMYSGEVLSARTIVHVVQGQETKDIRLVLQPGGSISGRVYRSDGVTPVEETKVSVRLSYFDSYYTKTASDGSYSFEKLPAGEYSISVVSISFKTDVSSGNVTYHDIVLPE
jgi:hypothetical protein